MRRTPGLWLGIAKFEIINKCFNISELVGQKPPQECKDHWENSSGYPEKVPGRSKKMRSFSTTKGQDWALRPSLTMFFAVKELPQQCTERDSIPTLLHHHLHHSRIQRLHCPTEGMYQLRMILGFKKTPQSLRFLLRYMCFL